MVLLWVALTITVLLGMGALTIDLGALVPGEAPVAERRRRGRSGDRLQLCEGSSCGSVMTIANTLADANSNDNASAVPKVCGVGPGLSASGCTTPSGLDEWLQLGYRASPARKPRRRHQGADGVGPPDRCRQRQDRQGQRDRTMGWPQVGAGAASLALSACEFTRLGGKLDGSAFPSGSTVVYFHIFGDPNEPGVGTCRPSTSGAQLPGGFGWIRSSSCTPNLTANAWSNADTGNNVPSGCNPNNWVGNEMTLALYDDTRGTGNGSQYHVVGFVSFKVTAFRFGNNHSPQSFQCPMAPGNSGNCIQGTFTKITKNGAVPGGPNLGVTTIKLIG